MKTPFPSRLSRLSRLWLVLLAGLSPAAGLAAAADAPDFKELFDLVRQHLVDADPQALNRAAVRGLLDQLQPQVTLLTGAVAAARLTNAPALAAARVLDRAFAYLRVGEVRAGLDQELWTAYRNLQASNRLRGVILDLRFADGQDYPAAAAAADRFFTVEKPLLDWGQGEKRSTEKAEAISGPLAILVNRQTAGSAEALAAILRHHQAGLLLGGPTAGRACLYKEFTLQTGQQVRIAVARVKLPGQEPLSPAGLAPDIRVEVALDEDRAWYEDASWLPPKAPALAGDAAPAAEPAGPGAVTNRPGRRRFTEADLVRSHREGGLLDFEATNPPPGETEFDRPTLRDPTLARALDLLKALAVVEKFRPL